MSELYKLDSKVVIRSQVNKDMVKWQKNILNKKIIKNQLKIS